MEPSSLDEDDLVIRRQAELEFVAAAFSEEEAWCEASESDCPVVHRQLHLTAHSDDSLEQPHIPILLSLHLVPTYPETEPLHISAQLKQAQPSSNVKQGPQAPSSSPLVKLAYKEGLSSLLSHCRETASSVLGCEGVFLVLSAADEWVQDIWPTLVQEHDQKLSLQRTHGPSWHSPDLTMAHESAPTTRTVTLGRRLIYSHHIIAKQKRKDLQELAQHYQLTGYVKIGWPGLIIMEGRDEDCNAFYDEIRQWSWQYLVVRGEMQEPITVEPGDETDNKNRHYDNQRLDQDTEEKCLNEKRRFEGFHEVSEMSIVAAACREADLEALFKTSMKVYDNKEPNDDSIQQQQHQENDAKQKLSRSSVQSDFYGALIHVDHMNDSKGYRKWLFKTSNELGTLCIVADIVPGEETNREGEDDETSTRAPLRKSSSHPLLMVILLGPDKKSVSLFLKRWRSSRVDVDSQGHACLERQMQVLVEGPVLRPNNNNNSTSDDSLSPSSTNASKYPCDSILWPTHNPMEFWDALHNHYGNSSNKNLRLTHLTYHELHRLVWAIGSQSWTDAVEQQQWFERSSTTTLK